MPRREESHADLARSPPALGGSARGRLQQCIPLPAHRRVRLHRGEDGGRPALLFIRLFQNEEGSAGVLRQDLERGGTDDLLRAFSPRDPRQLAHGLVLPPERGRRFEQARSPEERRARVARKGDAGCFAFSYLSAEARQGYRKGKRITTTRGTLTLLNSPQYNPSLYLLSARTLVSALPSGNCPDHNKRFLAGRDGVGERGVG